jgi:hypothetical protein
MQLSCNLMSVLISAQLNGSEISIVCFLTPLQTVTSWLNMLPDVFHKFCSSPGQCSWLHLDVSIMTAEMK